MLYSLLLATAMAPSAGHPNLIVNGQFTAGNIGFKSDYTFDSDVQMDGHYAVGKDPHDFHLGGASFGPHTPGTQMLVVNGNSQPTTSVWEQTVKVAPNHKYTFAFWAATWSKSNNSDDGDASPARLVVLVNGVAISQVVTLNPLDGKWQKIAATWSSADIRKATIRIVDENVDQFGNDFAIGDLVFHLS